MQSKMSHKKAVTFDGFSDDWLRTTKHSYLLQGWWNSSAIHLLSPISFEARLIPLNKAYSNLPILEQFRPIAILSSAVKWLENRFKEPLQRYVNEQIDKDQIGFVTSC